MFSSLSLWFLLLLLLLLLLAVVGHPNDCTDKRSDLGILYIFPDGPPRRCCYRCRCLSLLLPSRRRRWSFPGHVFPNLSRDRRNPYAGHDSNAKVDGGFAFFRYGSTRMEKRLVQNHFISDTCPDKPYVYLFVFQTNTIFSIRDFEQSNRLLRYFRAFTVSLIFTLSFTTLLLFTNSKCSLRIFTIFITVYHTLRYVTVSDFLLLYEQFFVSAPKFFHAIIRKKTFYYNVILCRVYAALLR